MAETLAATVTVRRDGVPGLGQELVDLAAERIQQRAIQQGRTGNLRWRTFVKASSEEPEDTQTVIIEWVDEP